VTGQHEFLSSLVDCLEQAGIAYMLAGSVGSSLHGRPRATQDVDIVVAPTEDQLHDFLESLGESYYVSKEAANQAVQHHTMFNVIDMESGWKADLIVRKPRPFSREEFGRRRQLDLSKRRFWVVSPEDVILSKLEWIKGRESEVQFSDALGVAIIHYHSLDRAYLKKWAMELGVAESLERLLKEAQESVEPRG
jgi:hypothetical protein